jgi:hypothetical protein
MPLDEKELYAFVLKQLPYYSVPERWIRVPEVPLTFNGKVDRAQLKLLVKQSSILSINALQADPEKRRSDSACDYLVVQTKALGPMSVISQKRSLAVSQNTDLEKGFQTLLSTLGAPCSNADGSNKVIIMPEVKGPASLAWLHYRIFIAYRGLLFSIVCANIGVACWLLHRDIGHHEHLLPSTATATAANLCAAILIRSEPVINLLFTVFSSLPISAPLRIRRICANFSHLLVHHLHRLC